jgi:hypothetical protein
MTTLAELLQALTRKTQAQRKAQLKSAKHKRDFLAALEGRG